LIQRRGGAGLVREVATLTLEPERVGIGNLGVATGADGRARDEAEVGSGLIRTEIVEIKNYYFYWGERERGREGERERGREGEREGERERLSIFS
jgi:hypothetical protein